MLAAKFEFSALRRHSTRGVRKIVSYPGVADVWADPAEVITDIHRFPPGKK